MKNEKENEQEPKTASASNNFERDLEFLSTHKKTLLLKRGNAMLAVVPDYQGRVMTSSAQGMEGMSFGWINYELIASGKTLPQINPVGGEERFWLGPEGGQFAIFFKNKKGFEMKDWVTPAALDTESFDLVSSTDSTAFFSKEMKLENYSGYTFNIKAERAVSVLTEEEVEKLIGISLGNGLESIGYRTENEIENTGKEAWKKETGLLSIWLLGMFNPGEETTVVIPIKPTDSIQNFLKDDYFGKVPSDRLSVTDKAIFFKGDGEMRGKIGIRPEIATPFLGSYDAANNVLTIIHFSLGEDTDYVNSLWELQDEPYMGDAVNSYNDGANGEGNILGPFYEIESSSPAKELAVGEKLKHTQETIHIVGSPVELDPIAKAVFGVGIEEIKIQE
ncbi:DUF6786 family protein [Flammeovirgaceae bacterium SG7u.111]|nr:DUF6786 family protein [Flammeovirgaceae bacterium SG7u.132]WPO38046.1 DUF6786 family protein [Flammeovirgaceae bacterium SG7u.111]